MDKDCEALNYLKMKSEHEKIMYPGILDNVYPSMILVGKWSN